MKKINVTTILLTIITLCELFYFPTGITNSIFLWMGYGIYRGIRYLFKNDMIG